MDRIKFLISFFLILVFSYGLIYAQGDPVGSKLKVEGGIEIGEGKSLRLKPVVGTMPASAVKGDLYFNGTALFTCVSDTCTQAADWTIVSEKGDIIYNNSDSSLYYRDNSGWRKLSGGGGTGSKTVASRIVAASNSLDPSSSRANYACSGTNDQNTIQTAINDLGTKGGAVYLLEGTYNISGSINFTLSNVSLIGAGNGTVLKLVSGSGINVINVSPPSGTLSGILISQLMIDGNNKTGTNNNGVYFKTVANSVIDKVWVENIKNDGIHLDNSSTNVISGNHIQSNGYTGIYLTNSLSNIISGNNIQSNSYDGIALYSSSNKNVISGNNIQSNSSHYGIYLNSSSNNALSGNNIQLNSYGIYLDTSLNNTIYSNNIQSNSNSGIRLGASSYNCISSNEIVSNATYGIEMISASNSNVIYSNTINDNGGSGNFSGVSLINAGKNLISSNRISDSSGSGSGIDIDSQSDSNYLVTNLIDGAGFSKSINDSGTNTKYTDKTKMTLEKKQIDISSSTYSLDITTYPQTYVSLNPSVAITNLSIIDGKSEGDLLIIENISTYNIRITENPRVNLGDPSRNYRDLGQYDVLELIWNGVAWLEVDYVNN